MFEVKLKCGQLSVYNYDKAQIHCPTIQCKEWQKQELVIKGSTVKLSTLDCRQVIKLFCLTKCNHSNINTCIIKNGKNIYKMNKSQTNDIKNACFSLIHM